MKKALCLATVVGLLAGTAAFGQVQKPSDLRFPPLSYDPPNPSDFRVDLGHGLRGYIQEDHSLQQAERIERILHEVLPEGDGDAEPPDPEPEA